MLREREMGSQKRQLEGLLSMKCQVVTLRQPQENVRTVIIKWRSRVRNTLQPATNHFVKSRKSNLFQGCLKSKTRNIKLGNSNHNQIR